LNITSSGWHSSGTEHRRLPQLAAEQLVFI
jgi:hypothetical protein